MAIIDPRCNSIERLQHNPELLFAPVGRQFAGVYQGARATRTDAPPPAVDIAIVGGGIIGCGIACQLLSSPRLRERVIILEAQSYLLAEFFGAMHATGQRVMRSPYEHQIAPDGYIQMLDFARLHYDQLSSIEREQIKLGLSGQRSVVPLDIFIAHATHVVSTFQLQTIAYQFVVCSMSQTSNGMWVLRDVAGHVVHARAVIIAIGNRPSPWGDILTNARTTFGDRVQSVYDPPQQLHPDSHVLVIGSGLSAGHCILRCIEVGAVPIWVVRDEEQYRCADFDTAYFRTEGIASFQKLTIDQKITRLRECNRGSLMLEFVSIFKALEEMGQLRVYRYTTVEHITACAHGQLMVTLSSGCAVKTDRILVATGFEPNTQLIPEAVSLIDQRYPVLVPQTLEVQGMDNCFVAGSLSSLELGPAAKNIDGARLAAERLLPVLEDRVGGYRIYAGVEVANIILGSRPIKIPE